MALKTRARVLFLLSAGCLLALLPHSEAHSATTEAKYWSAERCRRELKSTPGHQGRRDRWLLCIQAYLAVYRDDPHGPWAPAGLYQAGTLFAELFGRSALDSDRREAIDLMETVVRHFPRSRYHERARTAAERLKAGSPAALAARKQSPAAPAPAGEASPAQASRKEPAPAPAPLKADPRIQRLYEKAKKQQTLLESKPEKQKYRDQWLAVIGLYREVWQAAPRGALAPAALYAMAELYEGLYRRSLRPQDRVEAQKAFQEVAAVFPQSGQAEKARTRMEPAPETPRENLAPDAVAQMISDADPAPRSADVQTAAAAGGQTAVVEGLRFWSNPRYTRVVIDASSDTTFSHRELREDPSISKPQRIYVDLHNSRLSQNLQRVVPINDNLLSDARAGQYSADTVRVVVDIKSSKNYKIFSLKNPFRIILDVWGVDGQAPAWSETAPPEIAVKTPARLPERSLVKQLALGVKRIVIDPGHGGKDYGAPGAVKGVHEKHIVLQIGRKLADQIRSELGYDVVMTRETDVYLSLEERTAIANTQSADLFVSVHTNASPNNQAHGLETYILNLATDDEAILVAARENATSTKNISDLDSILKDLMNNAKVSESTRLASYVQQGTLLQLKKQFGAVRNKGVKKAPFYVLLGAEPPSILIETGFISNPEECRRLMDPDYQDHICRGIVDGIRQYIQEIHPMALGGQPKKSF